MSRSPIVGLHLVVPDLAATVEPFRDRGIDIGEPVFEPTARHGGSENDDYASYAEFADPNQNVWLLEEVPSRAASTTGEDG